MFRGQWKKRTHTEGADSNLRTHEYNKHDPRGSQAFDLVLAEVAYTQPEPLFKQHLVAVDFVRGGGSTSVAWPGPSVNLSKAGIPGGLAQAVHGVFEAPMPGQMVLIGFEQGNAHSPLVVQKYSYNPSQRTDLAAAFHLPLTSIGHGPTDVVIGHYLGSYLAFRGGPLGLPGSAELHVPTDFSLYAETGIQCETTGELSLSGGTCTMTDTAGNTIQMTPTGTTIEDAQGNVIEMTSSGISISDIFGNTIETGPTGITCNTDVEITL